MSVKETILTPDQTSMMQAQQSENETKFAEGLAKSFDLPSTLADALETEIKLEGKPKEEQVDEPQDASEESNEQADEQVQEESKEEEGGEEDLIPKSKVQKRIDELTREKARLESRLKRLEDSANQPKQPVDSDTEAISKMSEPELVSLKRQIRMAQIESAGDKAKLSQLLDLEDKVESHIRTAPQRFQQSQVSNFQSSWGEISSVEGESFSKDFQAKLFQEANNIYARSNALKRDVNGQAEALWAAYDKLSAIRSLSDGKTKTNELERQVNTLKKKISVDSSSKKSASQDSDSMAKLFNKAKNGDTRSKAEFFRKRLNTDALVSEDDLGLIR